MKKVNFLVKLKKQRKLQIVQPSEEIKDAYLQRSGETLRSARVLLEINNLRDAVALTYYSIILNVVEHLNQQEITTYREKIIALLR